MLGISWLAADPVSFSRRTLLHGVSNISECTGQVLRKHYHTHWIGCQLASSVPSKLPLLKYFEFGWKYVLASVIPCNISIYHNHQSLSVGLLLLCTKPMCHFTAHFFRSGCALALYVLLSERLCGGALRIVVEYAVRWRCTDCCRRVCGTVLSVFMWNTIMKPRVRWERGNLFASFRRLPY